MEAKKCAVEMWTGFMWLGLEFTECGNETWSFLTGRVSFCPLNDFAFQERFCYMALVSVKVVLYPFCPKLTGAWVAAILQVFMVAMLVYLVCGVKKLNVSDFDVSEVAHFKVAVLKKVTTRRL